MIRNFVIKYKFNVNQYYCSSLCNKRKMYSFSLALNALIKNYIYIIYTVELSNGGRRIKL